MSEMTISEAIERIQNIIERGNQINRGVHFVDKDLKALDKAVEVMEAYIQIGNVKPYHRAIK